MGAAIRPARAYNCTVDLGRVFFTYGWKSKQPFGVWYRHEKQQKSYPYGSRWNQGPSMVADSDTSLISSANMRNVDPADSHPNMDIAQKGSLLNIEKGPYLIYYHWLKSHDTTCIMGEFKSFICG